MTPLEHLESTDRQLKALLLGLPSLAQTLDQCLADTADVTLRTHVEGWCEHLRQRFHANLTDFWAQTDSSGHSRQKRLMRLRKEQLLGEVDLRLSDHTLHSNHAYALRICLELPLPWQRQYLSLAHRPQVYRPLLSASNPNWRSYLPGALVIVQTGPQGGLLEGKEDVGLALLLSFSHGIEAFDSLDALHTELCERLDDPHQSTPMLKLFTRPDDELRARQAERLRYDWFTGDLLEAQIENLLDAQRANLSKAWLDAWNQGLQSNIKAFDRRLDTAMNLTQITSSKGLLATRYALLLEKHLPAWLRASSQQARTQIMHTLQDLAGAIELAAAPGLLTLEQFLKRHNLLDWTQARLREHIRHDHGLDIDPQDIHISVTMARQVGPILHPFLPTGYIAVASRPQVGESIEWVSATYRLDEFALLNIAWFDIDYWLTARVHRTDGSEVSTLTPAYMKDLVRSLNVGSGYASFLRTHLIESPSGQWRQEAHVRISRARMRAEAVKARYAGHFLKGSLEQGYRWANVVLQHPDSARRKSVDTYRICVRQLMIQGHTVQGVLMLTADVDTITSFVLYTPDAPDRRPWREYRTARALLQALRNGPALRQYVVDRVPQADAKTIERLLLKGRLGPNLSRPIIEGNWCEAYYRAEVRALLAAVDIGSRTTREMNTQSMVEAAWLIVDLISLVLPNRALTPLAFGRAAIDVWDTVTGLQTHDLEAALHHSFSAISLTSDGLTSYAGSTFMRRALRGIPKRPPLPLPKRMATKPGSDKLRYRLDGIYGEGVYEKTSEHSGLSEYYIQDTRGRYYKVSFDGQRWLAIDPRQPDAYLKVPLKRREDGEWVIDSPVLWYDGLPDLQQLFTDCQPAAPLTGTRVTGANGLYQANGQLYLQVNDRQLLLRPHLLADRYHLLIPEAHHGAVAVWAILRWEDEQWRIRVRQTGRSSDWLALP
ncbi:MAG: hypothetical protein RR736_19320 [Pseudomonas sp.]|uniref:dermonecrotic toxin domain-containing protein n=1 Tax=Pseudomonas sp. TaxID=306 RepID=UPI002FC855EF